MLVPSSRAILVLTSNMSPESLDGLEEFSHVWITFKFHLNTNRLKEAKAFNNNANDNNKKYTFKAKITPPMLKEKKGVLATRSPHRPNPIGVTLAKIEKVDKKKRCIYLSACDLVEGTPVLDIKPYVPAYDTVPIFKVPKWIEETIDTRNKVIVQNSIYNNINRI
jgi:tRNA-Thr(GGU) m(6)t(6)A37 methyltransferase TsaA